MFTQKELNEIAAAHKAVYQAICNNFVAGDTGDDDLRAAEEAAVQIVAAKIIAGRNTNVAAPWTCQGCGHLNPADAVQCVSEGTCLCLRP